MKHSAQAHRRSPASGGGLVTGHDVDSVLTDTSLILNAFLESGLEPDHPLLLKAGRFLLRKEVREAGDLKYKNPRGPIGGWYFEFANQFYAG